MFKSNYDTINLRSNASFLTEVYPNVFWVPMAFLGQTRFTNSEMKSLHEKSSEDVRNILSNPYELIQYLQCNNFQDFMDSHINVIDGIEWHNHVEGKVALERNKGCCSSLSGLFTYIFKDIFNEIATLCMIANSGVGHTVNYIHLDGYYYIIDLYTQINSNAIHIAKETGFKTDFAKTKYVTGMCLKTNSLDSFIRFFERYNYLKKREFLFLKYNLDSCPPMALSNTTTDGAGELSASIVLPLNMGIEVLPFKGTKINFRFQNYKA